MATPTRPGANGAKLPVAILGATGAVGQRFVTLLADHPWFELVAVCASDRSAGRSYADAARWHLTTPLPERVRDMEVRTTAPDAVPEDARLVFSALDAAVAGEVETAWARAGALVVTNAKNHRMDADVPLVVPEVNPDHLELVAERRARGAGAIVANPNCSTIGLVLALAPLDRAFGVRRVHVCTLQAISGAGLPGVSAAEVHDNVLPFVPGEEDKLETEPRKIFGALDGAGIRERDLAISAACTRVPVSDGHTELVSVELEREATPDELVQAWNDFRGRPQELGLPTAPARPVVYLPDEYAPQPRLHRDLENGMGVAIGRLRACPTLDWRFVALSHNTVRGAAGGAVLLAETCVAEAR